MMLPTTIVLRRELTALSRRGATYAMRTACLAAVLGVFWMVQSDRGISRQLIAEALLGRLVAALVVIIVLAVPALIIQVIASEIDRDTLSLLLLTRLSPGSVLLQKLVSRLWAVLLLIASPLPLAAALAASNAVPGEQALQAGVSIAGILLGAIAAGIWTSTLFRTTWRRLVLAWLLSGAWANAWIVGQVAYKWVTEARAMTGLQELLHASYRLDWWQSAVLGGVRFQLLIAGVGVLAVVTGFIAASHRLQRLAAMGTAGTAWLPERMARPLTRAWRFLYRSARAPLAPLDNPFTWLETRRHLLGSTRLLVHLLIAIVVLVTPLAIWSLRRADSPQTLDRALAMQLYTFTGSMIVLDELLVWATRLTVLGVLATALLMGVTLLDRDRQDHHLDLQLATPMSRGYLIAGKYLCALKSLLGAAGLVYVALLLASIALRLPQLDWWSAWVQVLRPALGTALLTSSLTAVVLAASMHAGLPRRPLIGRLAWATAWLACWGACILAVDLAFRTYPDWRTGVYPDAHVLRLLAMKDAWRLLAGVPVIPPAWPMLLCAAMLAIHLRAMTRRLDRGV